MPIKIKILVVLKLNDLSYRISLFKIKILL